MRNQAAVSAFLNEQKMPVAIIAAGLAAAAALAAGSSTDRERGAILARWCASPGERVSLLTYSVGVHQGLALGVATDESSAVDGGEAVRVAGDDHP